MSRARSIGVAVAAGVAFAGSWRLAPAGAPTTATAAAPGGATATAPKENPAGGPAATQAPAPMPVVDKARIDGLVERLGDEKYANRVDARRELERLADIPQVAEALAARLKTVPDAEVRREHDTINLRALKVSLLPYLGGTREIRYEPRE